MTDLSQAYMTAEEVSKHLGICTGTLSQWRARKNYLPYNKFGNLVRYRTEDVEAFAVADRREVINAA
jgi:excisionase family DNA binding protein